MIRASNLISILIIFVLLGSITLWVLPTSALAQVEEKHWIGDTGSWFDDSNWNPFGVPQWDDGSVYLTSSDGLERTVYLSESSSNYAPITIDDTGGGTITLSVSGNGSYSTGYGIRVGVDGIGILDQSGGGVFDPGGEVLFSASILVAQGSITSVAARYLVRLA